MKYFQILKEQMELNFYKYQETLCILFVNQILTLFYTIISKYYKMTFCSSDIFYCHFFQHCIKYSLILIKLSVMPANILPTNDKMSNKECKR